MPYDDVRPQKPQDNTCEWCGDAATKAHPLRSGKKKLPTGQYLYTCPKHHHLAEGALSRERKPRD